MPETDHRRYKAPPTNAVDLPVRFERDPALVPMLDGLFGHTGQTWIAAHPKTPPTACARAAQASFGLEASAAFHKER